MCPRFALHVAKLRIHHLARADDLRDALAAAILLQEIGAEPVNDHKSNSSNAITASSNSYNNNNIAGCSMMPVGSALISAA